MPATSPKLPREMGTAGKRQKEQTRDRQKRTPKLQSQKSQASLRKRKQRQTDQGLGWRWLVKKLSYQMYFRTLHVDSSRIRAVE